MTKGKERYLHTWLFNLGYSWIMHVSMLSPRGGGDSGQMWGIWPLLPSPPSGIWLRISVPGWGRLLFLHGGMRPSHVIPRALISFRKRSMPFLTVNTLIGNQAFQNGCYICFSLGLKKVKTGYNLLMELKCTHQMLNFLYPHWCVSSLFLFIVSGNSIINS